MASQPQRPRSERLVIGIAGRIGAGKTSAGEYLSSQYGFQYLRYSLVLSEWLAKGPRGNARLQEIGWEVMAKGMQAELNRRLLAQVKPDASFAVDGLRHPLDYETLRRCYASSFHLLFIDAPQRVRWNRKKSRAKYRTFRAFEAADSHPVEQHIESLRADAAAVLKNENSLEDFYAALDQAVQRFKKEGQT
jgi:dephospho-CoA kinase